ncbi:YacL family protein [Neptunomonas phycophila]|uniref:UPF0231 family protein n=1 Tax=Neptunomonas phycophila TaxID=1572645 RepID=UPI0009491C9B|nr:YacL family protein [Neptunomonas phycophila]
MEYDFYIDDLNHPTARCSMESEAIGRWLTDECTSIAQSEHLLRVITELIHQKRFDYQQASEDWLLRMTGTDVEVVANTLGFEPDVELPEDLSFYDLESMADCGLEDFKALIENWLIFLAEC